MGSVGAIRAGDDASVILSDVPIVAQHTRLHTRQAESSLCSTAAYPDQAAS